MTTTSSARHEVDAVDLAAAVPAEVGVGQLGDAGQGGAGAHAHRLSVDGVGARRHDVERIRAARRPDGRA